MADISEKSADDKNELGINKHIYALGNSFKDGLIWGLAATAGAIALFAFGKKEGNWVDKFSGKLNEVHAFVKNKFAGSLDYIGKKVFNSEEAGKIFRVKDPAHTSGSAEITAAVLVGSAIGHFVQVPSFVKGLHTADQSIKKYKKLSGERETLIEANTQLLEDNAGYRKALADKPASFTELLEKSPVEASVTR